MKYVIKQANPDEAYEYFLATLSNRTRIKILNALLKDSKNVSGITAAVGTDQSTISNNLARLRSCGFVSVKPNGKERVYSLNKQTIEPLMKLINLHTSNYCIECIKKREK
jgi:DNA-binding transcriptional ArsR family regulator